MNAVIRLATPDQCSRRAGHLCSGLNLQATSEQFAGL